MSDSGAEPVGAHDPVPELKLVAVEANDASVPEKTEAAVGEALKPEQLPDDPPVPCTIEMLM